MRQMIFVICSGVFALIAILGVLASTIQGIYSIMQNSEGIAIIVGSALEDLPNINIQIILVYCSVMCMICTAVGMWRGMTKNTNAEMYYLFLLLLLSIFDLIPQWIWWGIDLEFSYQYLVNFTRLYVFGMVLSTMFLMLFGMYGRTTSITTYRSLSLVVAILVGLMATQIPIDPTVLGVSIMNSVSRGLYFNYFYGLLLIFCVIAGVFNRKQRQIDMNIAFVLYILTKGGLYLFLGSSIRVGFSILSVVSALVFAVVTYRYMRKISGKKPPEGMVSRA